MNVEECQNKFFL